MERKWKAAGASQGEPASRSRHMEEMLRRRQARNRKTARLSREREKQRIESLEIKAAQLAAEASALRTAVATTWHFAGPFHPSLIQHVANLAVMIEDPQVPEEHIRGLLDELVKDLNAEGKDRVESLKANFRALLEVMVPPHLQYFLWRSSQVGPHVLVQDLEAQLRLNPQQEEILHNCEALLAQHQAQLCEGLEGLTTIVVQIARHARAVTTLMDGVREILSPRQIGHFLLWLGKNYCNLDPEEVLSHGLNSAMVLEGEQVTL